MLDDVKNPAATVVAQTPTDAFWHAGIWFRAPEYNERGKRLPDLPDVIALLWTAEDSQGRAYVTRLLLDAERVSGELLRDMPLGRIETVINAMLRDGSCSPSESDRLTNSLHVELTRLRSALPQRQDDEPGHPRARLQRPPAAGGGEEFYAQVAAAYLETLERTRAVAPALAAEAEVPVATVHRWILEARRRGFLPPSGRRRS